MNVFSTAFSTGYFILPVGNPVESTVGRHIYYFSSKILKSYRKLLDYYSKSPTG